MSEYLYIIGTLLLKEDLEEILTAYVLGAIQSSLTTIFGEIGGCVDFEILQHINRSFVLQIPVREAKKVRAALTLISEFQGIPCYFKVDRTTEIRPII